MRDYLKILRRRWMSVALLTLTCAGAASLLTALQTPQYSSTARLFVTTSQADDGQLLQGGEFSAQRVKSYADLIGSRELAQRVIEDTSVDSEPSVLAARVSARAVVETVNLEITVEDADPSEAQLLTQSYAEQLRDLIRELETPDGAREAPIKATIVDAATFSGTPISPKLVPNLSLGIVAGLLLGLGTAILREILDTRIKSPEDISALTDAPTLGAIAYDPSIGKAPLLTDIGSHAPRAESFRVLRTNLQFVDVDSKHKTFVVTSALPGEGKTSTAVNLALSLAQGGSRVLLIEADLRRPAVSTRLELDNAVGVTSVLLGHVNAAEAVQIHSESGLHVLASGPIPPNPAELLQTRAMDDLLKSARNEFDVVVIDAPPLLPVTDAALLAAMADRALLVIAHGRTSKDQARLALRRLAQVEGQVAGLVLNRVPMKGKSAGYGYGYGYGYAPEGTRTTATTRAAR